MPVTFLSRGFEQTVRLISACLDGTVLVTLNGDPIARMPQGGGLAVADIVFVRFPG